MFNNTWRQLTEAEIIHHWTSMCSTPPYRERDRRKVRELLSDGYSPIQILYSMMALLDETAAAPFIWWRDATVWVRDDNIIGEGLFVQQLMDRGLMERVSMPSAWYQYLDNQSSGGVPSAGVEQAYRTAKIEMEKWLDDVLGLATSNSGAGMPQRSAPKPRGTRRDNPARLDR